MANKLKGKNIAILATDGFEEVELLSPKKALEDEGAHVDVVSLRSGTIKSWKDDDWHIDVAVDCTLDECSANDYDALVLPGGVINPDKLRQEDKALDFVKDFVSHGKPVGAICHGPQILASADVLEGKTVTSYESIKSDLVNSGAHWVNKRVVVDHGLITSRKPDDLNYFNKNLIKEFSSIVN